MMHATRFSGLAAVGLLVSTAGAQSIPELGGSDWHWSSVEQLRLPRAFVEAMGPVLGIDAEGENTQARCESSGTMTLVQNGSTFTGVANKTYNVCQTNGGQYFRQPSSMLQVASGQLGTHTLKFSFESITVRPCPHQAVITDLDGSRVTGLSATGRCILPGHPQSQSPIPASPPAGGTSKTLSWEAYR